MFTNEYKFDTEKQRHHAITHIAELVADGFVIINIEDDETKTLVTFEEAK